MRRGLTGRMVIASGLLAMVVGGTFAYVLLTITELRGTTDLRRQTREELVAADTFEKHVIDLETGLRGFVITRDESFLEPANEARAALPESARALERLAADEPVQLARVRRIVGAMNAYLGQYALPLVDAVRRNDPSARSVDRTLTAKRRVDALRQGLNSFRDAERVRLSTRDADVDVAARRASAAAAVGIAGSILLILLFAGYLTRVIVQPLRRAALMADRLAGGDLSARMPATDVAEIGTLQRSFNVMAGSLETSRDELASLLAEQAALRRVATLVAGGAAPAEVFAVTATEVCRLLGTNATALCRYEPDETVTVLALETGAELAIRVGARITLEGENAMGAVFRTGRAARQESFAQTTGTLADIARKGRVDSSVGAPIVVEGRLWGVVVVSSRGGVLPADTEQRLGDFTELVATTIANTDARTQVDRLAEEQAALRRVATFVAQESSPAEVFAKVVEELANVLGSVDCSLFRAEGDGTASAVALWGTNVSAGVSVGTRVSVDGEGAIASALRDGRPCRIGDCPPVAGGLAQRGRELGIRSAVGCPIVVHGRIWGAIGAARYEDEAFPPETETRIARFAELVAIAIANADARAEVERLAEEQAALRRVATLVAQGASPAAVFDGVAAAMESLLDADQVSLGRYEPGDEVTVVAHRGPNADRSPPGSRWSHEGQSVTAMVRRNGRPARIESFADARGHIAEIVRAMGMRVSVGAPITVDGRLWGVITARWAGEGAPPPDTERRMAKFAELLDTAIANADSRDQLTASRARLLTAADEARRRVVRDLHDGAQQRLVQTIINLRLAQQALRENKREAESLVADALEVAEQGNAELRELAHGILPPVLTRGGLRAAVRAVVRRLDLPVDVDVPPERFPAEIEASAYFIVAEALTNVVKHAHAERANISASVEDALLRLQVRDDGIGGADRSGHGLVGMSDRVNALGGRLEIESPPGGGTLLSATLPLPAC
jgi:signal transduction histidine kinase/CHASE3 domain sensor protein/soluble P-type ATPase